MVTIITEKELPASEAGLWVKAQQAVEAKNFKYAVSILRTLIKRTPGFLKGRQVLRACEVKVTPDAGRKTSIFSGVRLTTTADVPDEAEELFSSGSFLLKGEKIPCAPATLERLSPRHGYLTLHEGRYHQVRRMLAAVGAPVDSLHRLSIGSVSLDSLHLSPGEWIPFNPRLFTDEK